MRLSRLLVVAEEPAPADWPLMEAVVREVEGDALPGLTPLLRAGVREAAGLFWAHRLWVDYAFLCLYVVQARPGGEPAAMIHLRRELEHIFFDQLYGGSPW